jgi:hypothetical protein
MILLLDRLRAQGDGRPTRAASARPIVGQICSRQAQVCSPAGSAAAGRAALHVPAEAVQQQVQPGQGVVHAKPRLHDRGDARQRPALIRPDPNSFRSAAQGASSGGWVTLTTPTAPAPAWPMGTPTDAEAALWAELWTRPAASVWPRFHLTYDVAVHVRTTLAFEAGGYSNAALGGLVARQADNLGLTVAGAQRNRWLLPEPKPSSSERASITALPGGRT